MTALGTSSSHRLMARATTGQRLDIRYDPRTNSIVFHEHDWSIDVRGGATPRTAFHERMDGSKVRRLRSGRATA